LAGAPADAPGGTAAAAQLAGGSLLGFDLSPKADARRLAGDVSRDTATLLRNSSEDVTGAIALHLPPVQEASTALAQRAQRLADPDKASRLMRELLQLDGVIIAVLVDGATGHVLASDGNSGEIERAAQAAAEIMRTHRRTLRMMGHWRPSDPVDEVLVTAGSRYHVMRALHHQTDHFVLAVLDKLRCNLATTRFRIMETQQALS
jgi:hypothetical protein